MMGASPSSSSSSSSSSLFFFFSYYYYYYSVGGWVGCWLVSRATGKGRQRECARACLLPLHDAPNNNPTLSFLSLPNLFFHYRFHFFSLSFSFLSWTYLFFHYIFLSVPFSLLRLPLFFLYFCFFWFVGYRVGWFDAHRLMIMHYKSGDVCCFIEYVLFELCYLK